MHNLGKIKIELSKGDVKKKPKSKKANHNRKVLGLMTNKNDVCREQD